MEKLVNKVKGKNGILIFLHGVSTSGKTFIGKELANKLPDSICIDQDTFYRKEKPMITFSVGGSIFSGEDRKTFTVENWDSEESIDFEALRNNVNDSLTKYKYVIVTGFALRQRLMQMNADYSFLLKFNLDSNETVNRIATLRSETKKFEITKNTEKREKDYGMIIHSVWPFYLQTLKEIQHSQELIVYYKEGRVHKDITIKSIMNVMNLL
jgi:shikimate kinase